MGMLLHRHLVVGANKPPVKAEKLEKEFEIAKDKANDNKRKNSNGKNISK